MIVYETKICIFLPAPFGSPFSNNYFINTIPIILNSSNFLNSEILHTLSFLLRVPSKSNLFSFFCWFVHFFHPIVPSTATTITTTKMTIFVRFYFSISSPLFIDKSIAIYFNICFFKSRFIFYLPKFFL